MFKSNGRTAEDAGRAIEDAMAGGADGIKRLKEIGITSMKELTDRGFDPSKPETFFQALRKIYTDRGIIGYGMKVTSLADRFENLKEKLELVGIAAGEALMPILEIIVSGFTAVFNVIPKQISGVALAFTGLAVILGFFWDTLKVLGSGLKMVVGHLIQFSGGTLIAADSAKKASASNFLLGKSLQSIQAGVAGAAIGIAAGVAIGAGMLHLYSELTSASKGMGKIDEQRKNK